MRYFPLLLASILAPAHGCSRAPLGGDPLRPDLENAAPASSRADDEPRPKRADDPPFREGRRALDAIKEILLKRYDAVGLGEDELYRAAAHGMVERASGAKNRYDELLSPEALDVVAKEDLGGEVPGVGYHYDFDAAHGQVHIVSVVPGSPAEKAGLRAGDVVVRQDGRLLKGLTLAEFRAGRGKLGEPMDILVLRDDALVHFSIPRAMVSFDDVRPLVFGDVGYLVIAGFAAKTADKARTALGELAKAKVRALVVDLRRNEGGLFDGAVATAGVLLPEGTPLGALVARGKEERLVARGPGALVEVPAVVLVSEDTAAGAEVLAAALAATRHAKLVGTRTRGKWTVQNLDTLSNGWAIKYTAAHVVTADGADRRGQGLVPDVEVKHDDEEALAAQGVTEPERRLRLDSALRAAVDLARR